MRNRGSLAFFSRRTVALALLLMPAAAAAKTITAQSGSTADLQLAVDSASKDDVVEVPAGTFSFAGTLKMKAGVTLRGAGQSATILTKTGTATEALITVDCSNGEPFVISDLTLVGIDNDTTSIMDKGIRLTKDCTDFRITRCTFRRFGEAAIHISGRMRGVIDHSSFLKVYRATIGNFGYGVVVYGDGVASWNRPLALGTQDAVFVEDCYFTGNRHAIASNNGSRYVFRHNTISDNAPTFQAIDAHGFEYGSKRGSRSYEIYGNSVNNSVACWSAIAIRGGDGVIFDNTVVAGATASIRLTNGSGSGCYPCKDQIRELHIWNNTYKGAPVCATVNNGFTDDIKEGRDFFCFARPGYTPYTYPHPLTATGSPGDGGTPDGHAAVDLAVDLGAPDDGPPLPAEDGPPVNTGRPNDGCGCTTAADGMLSPLAALLILGWALRTRRRRRAG
jgi:MYXO-CTERM domain-containing protein